MTASGRVDMMDDEWESVWRDYDRRTPAPVAVPLPSTRPKARARRPNPLLLLALGLGFAFAPKLASLHAGPASGIDGLGMLASFSPAEAELPPLSTSVSRLAAHSAEAACWVMQLDPRRPACP
jgi:hypothetical protein